MDNQAAAQLDDFFKAYQALSVENLDLLNDLYAVDVVFSDPAHTIAGLESLKNYFAGMYENISEIYFEFTNSMTKGNEAFVRWQMRFVHPKLKKGAPVTVPGVTWLQFNDSGKVSRHHDYFDLGAMLYEHIPVLGTVIRNLKKRLAQ